MNCSVCSAELEEGAQFCGVCGTRIEGNDFLPGADQQGDEQPMVGFIQAISLGFSNYFNFQGRATRAEYWWWFLFTNLVGFVAGFVDSLLGTGALFAGYGVAGGIFYLVVIVPSLSLGARRLHDVNRSGWWQLLFLIPLLGWIILFYWAITPSNSGHNRFGYYPLSSTYKR